ncbi:MAG TPA: hypothetical protein VL404_07220, partial [Candidatus Eisenbacteria bacterium]|nr:hypothetical protein [Candidatus Eisenbacteria bacterium]
GKLGARLAVAFTQMFGESAAKVLQVAAGTSDVDSVLAYSTPDLVKGEFSTSPTLVRRHVVTLKTADGTVERVFYTKRPKETSRLSADADMRDWDEEARAQKFVSTLGLARPSAGAVKIQSIPTLVTESALGSELDYKAADLGEVLTALGAAVRTLHDNGVAHGDLTDPVLLDHPLRTDHIFVRREAGRVAIDFIDFGLTRTGVTDPTVFKKEIDRIKLSLKDFVSARPDAPALLEAFSRAYEGTGARLAQEETRQKITGLLDAPAATEGDRRQAAREIKRALRDLLTSSVLTGEAGREYGIEPGLLDLVIQLRRENGLDLERPVIAGNFAVEVKLGGPRELLLDVGIALLTKDRDGRSHQGQRLYSQLLALLRDSAPDGAKTVLEGEIKNPVTLAQVINRLGETGQVSVPADIARITTVYAATDYEDVYSNATLEANPAVLRDQAAMIAFLAASLVGRPIRGDVLFDTKLGAARRNFSENTFLEADAEGKRLFLRSVLERPAKGARLAEHVANVDQLREERLAAVKTLSPADVTALTASFGALVRGLTDRHAPAVGRDEPPFIVSNERTEEYLDFLASSEYPRFADGTPALMIGIGGQLNLDAAAALRTPFVLLADINPRMPEMFRMMEGIFRRSPGIDPAGFREEFLANIRAGTAENPHYFMDPKEEYLPEVVKWLDSSRNWINDAGRFEHIKRLFLDGRIGYVRLDNRNAAAFTEIRRWMDDNRVLLEMYYASNSMADDRGIDDILSNRTPVNADGSFGLRPDIAKRETEF